MNNAESSIFNSYQYFYYYKMKYIFYLPCKGLQTFNHCMKQAKN